MLVVQGKATLRFEDNTIDLQAGDYVNIPAHKRHRVESTDSSQSTIWLAIFYRD